MPRRSLALALLLILPACGGPDDSDDPADTDPGTDTDTDTDTGDGVLPGTLTEVAFATGEDSLSVGPPVVIDAGVVVPVQAGGFQDSGAWEGTSWGEKYAVLTLDDALMPTSTWTWSDWPVQALAPAGDGVLLGLDFRESVVWGPHTLPEQEDWGLAMAPADADGSLSDLRTLTTSQTLRPWSVVELPDGGHAAVGQFLPDVAATGAASTERSIPGLESGAYLARWDVSGRITALTHLADGSVSRIGQTSHRALDAWDDGDLLLTSTVFADYVEMQTVDGGPLGLSGAARENGFVARLDPDGRVRWLTELSGPGREYMVAGSASSDGGACVAGLAHPGAVLGPGQPSAHTFDAVRGFVARLGADGTVQWVQTATARDGDRAVAVPVDVATTPDGGCLWLADAGSFAFDGDLLLAAGEEEELALAIPEDAGHAVITEFTRDGRLEWGVGLGGEGYVTSSGFDLTTDGDIVGTGLFSGTFQAITPTGEREQEAGSELFVVAWRVGR